jgi:hypothetical protein
MVRNWLRARPKGRSAELDDGESRLSVNGKGHIRMAVRHRNPTLAFALLGAGLLAGCVPRPTGPAVLVAPAPGKSLAAFAQDQQECEQYGGAQLSGAASYENLQERYDIAYEQCMYGKGDRLQGYGAMLAPLPLPTAPGL